MSGFITKVTVTVMGLNHTFPDDIDMLLVGPEGQTVRIDMNAVADTVDSALRPEILRFALSGRYADLPEPERALDAILRRRQAKRDAVEIAQLKKRLAEPGVSDDQTRIREITARINELNQARLGLKG